MRPVDLHRGEVFGRLTVIRLVRTDWKRLWRCCCKCGNIVAAKSNDLRSGLIVSCGCRKRDHLIMMNTTHGETESPEYRTWDNMVSRCECENGPNFRYYGGRGIRVCNRWRESFSNFLADMGRRPGEGYSLDRINNDGDYEPGNCRWATQKEQMRNQRNNRKITVDGVTKTLVEWSEESGLGWKTIEYRVRVGWPSKRAVFEKPHRRCVT